MAVQTWSFCALNINVPLSYRSEGESVQVIQFAIVRLKKPIYYNILKGVILQTVWFLCHHLWEEKKYWSACQDMITSIKKL